jgi:hypothetical protein
LSFDEIMEYHAGKGHDKHNVYEKSDAFGANDPE